MERIVRFEPAYDRTTEGYGIHGVNLRMLLKGEEGVVQFVLFTNWLKDREASQRFMASGSYPHLMCDPMPADLGYHSSKPRYEDQQAYPCEYLPEGKCYYDGSSLNAERVFKVLVDEGDEGVWRELESYYKVVFDAV